MLAKGKKGSEGGDGGDDTFRSSAVPEDASTDVETAPNEKKPTIPVSIFPHRQCRFFTFFLLIHCLVTSSTLANYTRST